MDWLQLLASIVDSLAWPVTIGLVAYLLRRPLVELLPNLRRLKYKELDIEFEKGLAKVEQELEELPRAEMHPSYSKEKEIADEKFDLLVGISPNAAVLDAWTDVERMLRALAAEKGVEDRRQPVMRLTGDLVKSEVISSRLASLVDDLRILRNLAAHPTTGKQITLSEAYRYKELSDQVETEIELLLS